MSDTLLILIGTGMMIVGLLVSGSGRGKSARVGNTGFSVFGAVTQTFHSVGMAINGERQKTPRDWIGWGISASGLVVGLVGLFKV